MQVSFQTDDFGRLTCDISDAGSQAVVTASNKPAAHSELAAAVKSVVEGAFGECFWEEACGRYRWVFRRDRDRVRVAVMWSAGTLTGWEHVFWSECDLDTFAAAFGSALEPV